MIGQTRPLVHTHTYIHTYIFEQTYCIKIRVDITNAHFTYHTLYPFIYVYNTYMYIHTFIHTYTDLVSIHSSMVARSKTRPLRRSRIGSFITWPFTLQRNSYIYITSHHITYIHIHHIHTFFKAIFIYVTFINVYVYKI